MDNEIKVDETKVKFLMKKIVLKENLNLKTHEKNDAEMVKSIRKEIEEAVKCY